MELADEAARVGGGQSEIQAGLKSLLKLEESKAAKSDLAKDKRKTDGFVSAEVVSLEYADLVAGKDLTSSIEKAFSYKGLGILTVVNVPGLAEKRQALLPLARAFAELPPEAKAEYERPSAFYAVGWSHGKEKLGGGQPDLAKGSYYANPLYDHPARGCRTQKRGGTAPGDAANGEGDADADADADAAAAMEAALVKAFPSFLEPNVWPSAPLPSLEPCFKAMGGLVVEVGLLVAKQCDAYVTRQCASYPPTKLFDVISTSRCCKGRLLHYFAAHDTDTGSGAGAGAGAGAGGLAQEKEGVAAVCADAAAACASGVAGAEADASAFSDEEGGGEEGDAFSDWCGWHNDHGSLTGLVPAMYLDAASGDEVPCPDPEAGLYIRSRSGQLVKPRIPANGGSSLAFQIGETAQIHSGGLLQATPHAVRGVHRRRHGSGRGGRVGVTRETLAVFMEPNWDGDMAVPLGRSVAQAQDAAAAHELPPGVPPLAARWAPGMDFGAFTAATHEAFY